MSQLINQRIAIAALTLSASAFVGIAANEGYEPVAKPPIPGDVPTLGFGETKGVKHGDKTTPVRALVRLMESADGYQRGVKRCVKVPLYQNEFDAYVDFTYQMGVGAFCGADFVKKLNAGDYAGACRGMANHPDGSPAWSNAQGKYWQGIHDRRIRNRDLCLKGAQ